MSVLTPLQALPRILQRLVHNYSDLGLNVKTQRESWPAVSGAHGSDTLLAGQSDISCEFCAASKGQSTLIVDSIVFPGTRHNTFSRALYCMSS